MSPSLNPKLIGFKFDSCQSLCQTVSIHQVSQNLLHVQLSIGISSSMVDKLPEEMMLHCKMFGSWQELLACRQVTCCLIVFKCLAQNLWFLLSSQLQLVKCVLDEIANGCQCLHRVGWTNALSMSGAQTDLQDQLRLTDQRCSSKGDDASTS